MQKSRYEIESSNDSFLFYFCDLLKGLLHLFENSSQKIVIDN